MSVYRRGGTWWFKFRFAGKILRESAKTRSITLAKKAEHERRKQLELGYNNLVEDGRNLRVRTLKAAADEYRQHYQTRNSANAASYVRYCVKHLVEHLGS